VITIFHPRGPVWQAPELSFKCLRQACGTSATAAYPTAVINWHKLNFRYGSKAESRGGLVGCPLYLRKADITQDRLNVRNVPAAEVGSC
jgi:hypothetical protein